jgi:hypothetical protein
MTHQRMRLLAAAVLLLAVVAGCGRKARTPAAAYERFAAAVRAGDAAGLYRALDQQSQWSVISTQRYYREIVDIVSHGYPPDARQRELGRVAGAELRKPAAFFAAQNARRGGGWVSRCAAGVGGVARIEEQGATAVVHTDRGGRFEFASSPHGWGFSGLRAELDELKSRASHDVETARENAKIYEQAGGAAERRP